MFEKLETIEATYDELTQQMTDPTVIADQSRYAKVAKQHRDLSPVIEQFRTLRRLDENIAGTREILKETNEADMRELAEVELDDLVTRRTQVEKDLKFLLLPRDPNDDKNVILEVRAGTGGEEACLFAADVLRMYSRYAERLGWRFQVTDSSPTGLGGIQKAEAIVEGDHVYSKLKHESGVHRVQRVPQTEASGRIHTSAVTVAVLPEAEEVISKSIRRIFGSTPSVPRDRADSQSIPPTPRSALPTCRRIPSSRCRTRSHRSRTERRRCASCDRASTRLSASVSRMQSRPSAGRR